MDLGIQGKVALVTGAGARVGNVIARRLADAGATIAVHYRNSGEGAQAFVAEIIAGGGQADMFQADLANREQAEKLIPAVVEKFGSLDILINNASVFQDRWLEETSNADWDVNLAVNVTAPFLLSRAMAEPPPLSSGAALAVVAWICAVNLARF